jgi:hypothetical protein
LTEGESPKWLDTSAFDMVSVELMTLIAMKYAAEMRSNLKLLGRSPIVDNTEYAAAFDDAVHFLKNFDSFHNLEQRNLNYPPTMEFLGIHPEMSFEDKKRNLQIYSEVDEDPELEEFNEWLLKSGDKQRQSNWIWRVGAAAEDLQNQGWYPFFVTLTVDPKKLPADKSPRDLWQEGAEFRKWKRKVSKTVTSCLGHQPAHKTGVPDSTYFRYFGVLEHGKSRVHDHLHILLWMRAIPEDWKRCPNRGIRVPTARTKQRCLQLETFWPWAAPERKPALYFRTLGDVWERLGFTVPYLFKKKRFLEPAPPQKAGMYLAKYMGKDEKEWKHRVKATRGLGLEVLKDRLERLSKKKLEALTWRAENQNTSISLEMIHSVPLGLIRYHAKRTLWLKAYSNRMLNWQAEMMKNYDCYGAMRQSVKNGARPHKMPSQDRYDWVTQHLPVQKGYCEKRLVAAHKSLRHLFPKPPDKQVKKIGVVYE